MVDTEISDTENFYDPSPNGINRKIFYDAFNPVAPDMTPATARTNNNKQSAAKERLGCIAIIMLFSIVFHTLGEENTLHNFLEPSTESVTWDKRQQSEAVSSKAVTMMNVTTTKVASKTVSNTNPNPIRETNNNIISSNSNSNNSVNNGRGDEDPRPWFILHVGPQKTATTTIQEGLTMNAKMLAQRDNYYYMGKSLESQSTRTIDLGGEMGSLNVFKLKDFDSKGFRQQLTEFQSLGRNVILSSEQYTSWGFSWKDLFDDYFRLDNRKMNQETKIRNTNAEPFFGFRVKIVVGYRHFGEWLPSLYYQTWLGGPSSKTTSALKYFPGFVEYAEFFLDRLVQYDPDNNNTNIHTTSGFENGKNAGVGRQNSINDKETSHGGVWDYLKFSERPELSGRVEVFDLHHLPRVATRHNSDSGNETTTSRDLLADFVCQILPSASHTCAHLVENNSDKNKLQMRTSATKDFVSMPDIHRINTRARSMPALNSTMLYNEQRKLRDRIHLWFSNAGLKGSTDTPKSRELTKCMGEESIRRLKAVSWNFLLQLVLLSKTTKTRHDMYPSSAPKDHLLLSPRQNDGDDDDGSWLLPTKIEHDESFDRIEKGKFCELDIDKLFDNQSFVEFVFSTDNKQE